MRPSGAWGREECRALRTRPAVGVTRSLAMKELRTAALLAFLLACAVAFLCALFSVIGRMSGQGDSWF